MTRFLTNGKTTGLFPLTCPSRARLLTMQPSTCSLVPAARAEETPPTRNNNSPVCRMNLVPRNSLRNRAQAVSAMSCRMYCGQTAASLNPRYRTAYRTTPPAFPELEIHSLDHTSHNDTRKSAYLLLHVSSKASVYAAPLMSATGIIHG